MSDTAWVALCAWYDAEQADLRRLPWHLRDDRDCAASRSSGSLRCWNTDRRRRRPLLPTLEAYLVSGGRKAETARVLHLERRSLYHRVRRIEELLGEALDDEETA